MPQGFVAFLGLRGLWFRRIQDGPEFIEVAKYPVSLNSNFFSHSKYLRIILPTTINSNDVVFQKCPLK